MTTSCDLSRHLNALRSRKKNNKHTYVPRIGYSKYNSMYEEINKDIEGIDEHFRIPFIPIFNGKVNSLLNFLTMTHI